MQQIENLQINKPNIIGISKPQPIIKLPLDNLENNTTFNLSLSNTQSRTSFHYYSQSESKILENTSPKDTIINLSQNYLMERQDIFSNKDIEISLHDNQEIVLPIKPKDIRFNSFEDLDKISNFILLIKFKPVNNSIFCLNKYNILDLFFCNLNAKIDQNNNLFFKDLLFSIGLKKVIKSIQIFLEQNQRYLYLKEFIVPLLEQPNIAILIQTKNDINRTNFNCLVKNNFKIKGIYVALNIGNVILDNNINYKENSFEKNYEDANTTITTNLSFSTHYFPLKNIQNRQIQEYYKNKEKYNNDFSFTFYSNKFDHKENYHNKYSNAPMISFFRELIIVNSDDLFAKTLFNKYQDKTNTICNFKIVQDFLRINKTKFTEQMNLINFFNIFEEISCLSLQIPVFKFDGNITKICLTPSLKSLKLYIKDEKLYKILNNKYIDKKKELKGNFIINLINNNIIKITYNEQRPYYLTESLYDKISELIDEIKLLKKIKINKIILDKSYLEVSWNIINSDSFSYNKDSFDSYYLFNAELLGIVYNLYENNDFWIRNIQEITNKRGTINYNILVDDNRQKIQKFINDSDLN